MTDGRGQQGKYLNLEYLTHSRVTLRKWCCTTPREMQAEFRLVGYKMFSLLSRSAWRLNLTTRLQLEGPALSIVTHTQLPEISCSSVIRNHREQNSEIIITIIIIIIIQGLLRRLRDFGLAGTHVEMRNMLPADTLDDNTPAPDSRHHVDLQVLSDHSCLVHHKLPLQLIDPDPQHPHTNNLHSYDD